MGEMGRRISHIATEAFLSAAESQTPEEDERLHDFMSIARIDAERAAPEPPARRCDTCRYWTRSRCDYGQGDCEYADAENPDAAISIPGIGSESSAIIVTPCDWYCRGWEARKESDDNEHK